MTYIITFAFLLILASLVAALIFMMRGGPGSPDKSKRMARALALRVGLSVALFLAILFAWQMGYIQPTGIQPGR
jgi:hypothetical protein